MYISLIKRGIAAVALFALLANSGFAAPLLVDSNADTADAAAGNGACATAGAVCTLRAAIEEANALGGADTITFNAGMTITPGSAFATITEGVTIDGSVGTVQIDGTSAGAGVHGLDIDIAGVTINKLYIYKFGGAGIRVNDGAKDVVITGNTIGTNAAGDSSKGNASGISVTGGTISLNGGNGGVEGLIIGGDESAERNVIVGNTGAGIEVGQSGDTSIAGTITIQGNYIGLKSDGTTVMANGGSGIAELNNKSATADWLIGTNGDGTNDSGERNIISGNTASGVNVSSGDEVTVAGNVIGLDSAGGADGNGLSGVAIDARVVRIGSDLSGGVGDAAEGNTISKNSTGINLTGTEYSTVTIYGNEIGVATNGSGAYGNTSDGIYINDDSSTATTINIGGVGVTAVGDGRNVISNNGGLGVNIQDVGSGSSVTMQNNIIGYDSDGTTVRGNTGYGAQFTGTAGRLYSLLFGTDGNGTNDDNSDTFVPSREGNLVGNNGAYGVSLSAPGMTSFTVAGNTIKAHSNRELGIGALTGLTGNTSTIGGDLAVERNVIGGGVDGILFDGNLNGKTVTVRNNYVGVDTNGTTDIGGSANGIAIGPITDGSTIGIQENVISGNTGEGIKILASVTSATINIIGNMIGTNAAGTAALANNNGIVLLANITIGIGDGTVAGRNIISGNTISGVHPKDGIANILGNYIGTNAAGTGAVPNGSFGVQVGNTAGTANVGNGTAGGRNVISGNTSGSGVNSMVNGILNALGNYVGVDATGLVALPNGFGFNLSPGGGANVIGDGTAGGRNIISGNSSAGIQAGGSTASIKGNYIGTAVNGTSPVPNGSAQNSGLSNLVNYGGVYIMIGAGVTLGGDSTAGDSTAGEGNVISGNYGQGVFVMATTSLAIRGNYIGVDAGGVNALPNRAGSATYALLTNGDSGLNGSGVILADYSVGISGVTIGGDTSTYRNVIAGNNGYGLAILGSGTGAGFVATNGSIKNNFLGYLTNGTKLANGSYEIYVNKNGGTITGLAIGGSGGENSINNDSHVGIRLVDVTDDNFTSTSWLSSLQINNSWTDTVCPIVYAYWERLTGVERIGQMPAESFCGSGGGGIVPGGWSPGGSSTTPITPDEITEIVDDTETAEMVEATVEPTPTTTETEETVQSEEMVEVVVTESEASDALQTATDTVINTVYDYIVVGDDEIENPTMIDLDDLLAQFETEAALTETPEITVERQQIEEFLESEGTENAEAVQTIVTATMSDSVKRVLGGGGGGYRLNEDEEIDEKTTFEFEFDSLRALNRRAEARKKGENVFVMTTSTDLDRDGTADIIQIAENGKLFEEGEVTANEKIFFGASLARSYKRLEDILPGVPTITNIPKEGAIVGKEIELWIANAKIGEKLDIFLVDPETEEEFHAAKTETDKRYRGAYTLKFEEVLEKEINEDTEYYIVVQNKRGQGSLTKVTVDPDLELEAVSVRLTGGRQTFNETLYSTVLLAAGGEKQENATLSGYAEPGSKVYVTWRSLVMSSVVVADASQGYFEVEAPEDLEEGDHEAIVYVFRDRQKLVGNITSLLFRK